MYQLFAAPILALAASFFKLHNMLNLLLFFQQIYVRRRKKDSFDSYFFPIIRLGLGTD
ncbi:hypothetical protein B4073_0848 [Bacillus subtilis]|nr:hypothetical protein B4068_0860 [Bacillus subtilis]KIN56079.1 hypothetical protein B4073_0848 [Bacillus subtilis]